MTSIAGTKLRRLLIAVLLLAIPGPLYAWSPNAADRVAAINAGDFGGYLKRLSAWLGERVPADASKITPASMTALLNDRAFVNALAERHLITKVWGEPSLGAWSKADAKNREFLRWLMGNPEAMDTMLLTLTPTAMFARIDDSHNITVATLEEWKRIYFADPASRDGVYLRLAIACVLRPPGSANQGVGRPKKQNTINERYTHYRLAHANGELLASFDGLSAWEMTHVVSAGASNADLAWGREMINTFMPGAKQGENVVSATSLIKNHGSQIPYSDMSCIIAGSGQCGPRSSFGVFINQAWGIPSIGVGQPAHAAICWRGPDGQWKIGYGRGWNVSKVADRYKMSGDEFLAMTAQRASGLFADIEHLRWTAALIEKPDGVYLPPDHRRYANTRAAAVMAAGQKLLDAGSKHPQPPPQTQAARAKPTTRPAPRIDVPSGVIHVEASDYFTQGAESAWGSPPHVPVVDSYEGGKQLGFHVNVPDSYVGYKITVPKAGVYELTARAAVVDWNQTLFVRTFGTMHTPVKATASAVFKNWVNDLGPQKAIDGDLGSRWAVNEGVDKAWLEIDLGRPRPISKVMIDERRWNRVSRFRLEYKVGEEWKTIFEGTNIGMGYRKAFDEVTAQHVRLNILDCRENGGPTIWEFSVGTEFDGHAYINPTWSPATVKADWRPEQEQTAFGTAGRWQITEPRDVRLAQGEQTIWLAAPFQRGLALKSFQLKPKD